MVKKSESLKQARFGFRNWDLSLWVCFGFRYSDFGFSSLVSWREKQKKNYTFEELPAA